MSPRSIVTAGDSGIGRAVAVALAARGHDVGLTWHEDETGAEETAGLVQQHGVRAEIARLDLSDPATGRDLVDDLWGRLGGLDAFVNNAGTGGGGPFLEHSLEDWQRVINVDLTGAFVCAQRAAQIMVEAGNGGRIVNVTSVHEHIPLVGTSSYSAAKGGLGLLTQVMALELAEKGITVNAVAPGEIATPMTGNEDEDVERIDRPGIPMGRPGDAREVADLIAWLCSEESSYVTGSSYVIDGGLMLMAAEANRRMK